jgi:hypothetical protein
MVSRFTQILLLFSFALFTWVFVAEPQSAVADHEELPLTAILDQADYSAEVEHESESGPILAANALRCSHAFLIYWLEHSHTPSHFIAHRPSPARDPPTLQL